MMKRGCLLLFAACGGGGEPAAADATVCPVVCQAPSSSADVDVCGNVLDLTSAAGVASDGLTITFHDASTPLSPTSLSFACGEYIADGLPAPASGQLLISVDGPGRRTTTTVVPVTAGTAVSDAGVWSVLASSDQAWTQEVGGTDLIDQGAVFLQIGGPGKDVTITGTGTAYYFSDSGAVSHTTIDPAATSTAANGGVLLSPVDGVVQVSGGPSAQLTSVPGALLVPVLR